jgi:type III secretion protein V
MRVLRALVAEEVSIRNLRLILEKVLDYDYVLADDLAQIVFDERLTAPTVPDAAWLDDPANLAAFVRTGLKHYLSHKHTKGQNALLVNLLDLKLEQALAAHQKGEVPLDERQRDRILDGVRAEQGDRYQLASPPALLTTASARTALREVVALEFPHVPVLAYQELSPDLNIQPLARIRLTD